MIVYRPSAGATFVVLFSLLPCFPSLQNSIDRPRCFASCAVRGRLVGWSLSHPFSPSVVFLPAPSIAGSQQQLQASRFGALGSNGHCRRSDEKRGGGAEFQALTRGLRWFAFPAQIQILTLSAPALAGCRSSLRLLPRSFLTSHSACCGLVSQPPISVGTAHHSSASSRSGPSLSSVTSQRPFGPIACESETAADAQPMSSRSPRDSPPPPAAPAALAVWPRLAPAQQSQRHPHHQREDSQYSDDVDHVATAAAAADADADEDRSDSESPSTSVAPPPVPALPSQPFPPAASSSLSPAALRAQRYFAGMADSEPAEGGISSDDNDGNDGHASDDDDQGDFLSPEAPFGGRGRPRGARIGAFKDGGSDSDGEYHLSDGGEELDSNGDESSMIMHSRNRLGHHSSFSQSQLEHFLSPQPAAFSNSNAAGAAAGASGLAPLGPPIARAQLSQLQQQQPQHPNGHASTQHAGSSSYIPSAVVTSASASSAAVGPDGARRYPLPPGPSPHSSPPPPAAAAHASPGPAGGAGSAGAAAAPSSNRTLGQLHSSSAPSHPPPPKPASSPAQHREDVSTLDYYLRQALASKDYPALHDLVARANEQHLSSELIAQARSVLIDKRAEDVSAEIGTLMHYMRASIDARSKDACIESLRKGDSLAHTLQSGPHRRLYADFFERLEECRRAVDEFEREDAQTVSVYLRQGTQLRSREVLQAALTKATSVRHSLLDQSILTQAKSLLTELDSQVMLRNFLTLAIRNRDPLALEDTISQAAKLHLQEKDAPELAEARRLADELRLHPHLAGPAASSATPSASSGSKGDKTEKQRQRDLERERERDRERAEKEAQKALERAEKERRAAEKDALRSAEKERKAELALAAAQSEAAAAGEQEKEKTKSHEKIKERLSWFNGSKKKKSGGAKNPAAASAASADGGGGAAGSHQKLFGGSLSLAISRNPSGSGVPRVVEDCVAFLRSSGALDEPGLFRVAGNKDAIDLLRAGYEANYDPSSPAPPPPPPLTETHDVSGLFKLYFRLLPEPLIPWDMYDRFVKVGLNRGDGRVEAIRELVGMLPRDNFGQQGERTHERGRGLAE